MPDLPPQAEPVPANGNGNAGGAGAGPAQAADVDAAMQAVSQAIANIVLQHHQGAQLPRADEGLAADAGAVHQGESAMQQAAPSAAGGEAIAAAAAAAVADLNQVISQAVQQLQHPLEEILQQVTAAQEQVTLSLFWVYCSSLAG